MSFPHFIPDSWDDKLGSYLRAGEGCRRRLICSFHSSLYLGVTLNCLCLEVKKQNKKTSMFLLHGFQILILSAKVHIFIMFVTLLFVYYLTVSFIIIKGLCNCGRSHDELHALALPHGVHLM